MSDTPKLADECKRLLDNGWGVVLFKNELGSYTAIANPATPQEIADSISAVPPQHITDDFEPSQALYRLTEKVFGNIA